jgi:hypothetical protein
VGRVFTGINVSANVANYRVVLLEVVEGQGRMASNCSALDDLDSIHNMEIMAGVCRRPSVKTLNILIICSSRHSAWRFCVIIGPSKQTPPPSGESDGNGMMHVGFQIVHELFCSTQLSFRYRVVSNH